MSVVVALMVEVCLGTFMSPQARAQANASDVHCGLGPPPNSDDFVAWNARRQQQTRERGYELVCDADLERYDIPWKTRPLDSVRLVFEPIDLARTPFAMLEDKGNQVETIADKRSRLYRRFGLSDGHVVVLSEHDMSADHSHSWRDPKDEPERVGTRPARLVVLQTPSGKAVSNHLDRRTARLRTVGRCQRRPGPKSARAYVRAGRLATAVQAQLPE